MQHGETGHKLSTRTREHKAEVEELPSTSQTKAARKDSTTISHKSAICDHIHQENHVKDWGQIKTVDRDNNRLKRQIRERISIRQHGKTVLNRDEGSYDLPHAWDTAFPTIKLGVGQHHIELPPLPQSTRWQLSSEEDRRCLSSKLSTSK